MRARKKIAATRRPRDSRREASAAKPLSGVRVLVGRARHQAGALSVGLRKLGAQVIEIPFIEIRRPTSYWPLDTAIKNIRDYDWLVLTSVNGVEAFWERSRKLRVHRKSLQHLKVAAIGPATRKAIEQRGLAVEIVPEEYVAESVVESLRDVIAGNRVLLARAKVARDVIPRELRKLGAKVDVVEAYETVVPRSSQLQLRAVLNDQKRRPDVITFTSSSTARNFVELLRPSRGRESAPSLSKGRLTRTDLGGIKLASIGPVTSATLRELKLGVDVEAKEYTIPGLVQAIVDAYSR